MISCNLQMGNNIAYQTQLIVIWLRLIINVCVSLAVLLVQHAKCTVKLNSYLKSKKLALFQVFYYVQGNLSS